MSIYEELNEPQREAVFYTEGPLLILAGAGSGKTRVLTHRVAYLIEECQVNPWNVLAITFTNKAAKEMKQRVERIVASGAQSVWISTFHSMCVRILRRHAALIGYDSQFSIYDTDDQKTVIKQIIKKMDLDPKLYRESIILHNISSAKNSMIMPEQMATSKEYRTQQIAEIYRQYEERLKQNNAFDFDDLLLKTVQLFQDSEETLRYYQNRFRYIMVDEYQDTNAVQFQLIWLLAREHKNICVVGDDDQSIYRFRGADITNILSFEEKFAGTKVIKLEQNYRSTMNILRCANAIISNNTARKEKHLWSERGDGASVIFREFNTGFEEAESVVRMIQHDVEMGEHTYDHFAILYRTNAQSRLFEEKLVHMNIPYRLIGGINFYQRAEIKDILSYLKAIANGRDDLAVRRIINVPKRGIGATSIERVQNYADEHEITFFAALENISSIPNLGRTAAKMQEFVQQIYALRESMKEQSLTELIYHVLECVGYWTMLLDLSEDVALTKKENIDELISKAKEYEIANPDADLVDFLAEVALVADIDNMDESETRVTLMTLHSSKGLEFHKVFLCGMEEGLFPSFLSINSEEGEIAVEEERRLCYVGITRAMDELIMTMAKMRMTHGENHYSAVSRFIKEIPDELFVQKKRNTIQQQVALNQNAAGSATNARLDWKKKKQQELERHGGGFGTGFKKPVVNTIGKEFTVSKSNGLDYAVGDTVRHIKFGVGVVKEIVDGKKDYEVTVDFARVGEKHMFAAFAKLKKV